MPPGPISESDTSNGWEAIAGEFIAHRARSRIGVGVVRAWAQYLPRGASILDLGCGSGVPISEALMDDGFVVYGIDASPTLVAAFRERLPSAPVACEPAETSQMFGRTFDGILAVGLMFLLPEGTQRDLIRDLMTGRESRSLGAETYAAILAEAGLVLNGDATDEGDTYYYRAVRRDCGRARTQK
ncbi:MAG: class I SAM-dependent methyltransferase [Steroidobacteraceae bacterium]